MIHKSLITNSSDNKTDRSKSTSRLWERWWWWWHLTLWH